MPTATPKDFNKYPQVVKSDTTPALRAGVVRLLQQRPGHWVIDPEGDPFTCFSEQPGLVTAVSATDPIEYVTITTAQWDEHAVSRAEGSGAPGAGAVEKPPDGEVESEKAK
jgi:hypothetical protein